MGNSRSFIARAIPHRPPADASGPCGCHITGLTSSTQCRRVSLCYDRLRQMSSLAFDLRRPELVAAELDEANRRLAREQDVPPAIAELVRNLADVVADL